MGSREEQKEQRYQLIIIKALSGDNALTFSHTFLKSVPFLVSVSQ